MPIAWLYRDGMVVPIWYENADWVEDLALAYPEHIYFFAGFVLSPLED